MSSLQTQIVDEIYNMMISNIDYSENRSVFSRNKRGFMLGLKLYKVGGVNMLFDTMRVITEKIMYNQTNYDNIYYLDQKELEHTWTSIDMRFHP
jgi:hypothetical protein